MDESVLVMVGVVVGVTLLYVGSRVRGRARTRPRPKGDGPTK